MDESVLFFHTIYPLSFFGFGYPFSKGSYKSWIKLSRDDHGLKELYGINRWIHVCFGYRKRDGFVVVVRVCTVENSDTDIGKVLIKEFTRMVKLLVVMKQILK